MFLVGVTWDQESYEGKKGMISPDDGSSTFKFPLGLFLIIANHVLIKCNLFQFARILIAIATATSGWTTAPAIQHSANCVK